MSAIQKSILSAIAIGKAPIIILYLEESDGDYLSLLLSNHLISPYEIFDRPLTTYDNYFSTSSFRNLLSTRNRHTDRDWSSVLKLVLDEGFDTRRLYGLSIPMSLFSTLNLERDYKDAHFIFIYREAYNVNSDEAIDWAFIEKFITSNNSATYINALHFYSKPKKIVGQLAELFHTEPCKIEKVLPEVLPKNDLFFNPKGKSLYAELMIEFQSRDLMPNAFSAAQFTFIFYVSSIQQLDLLTERIKKISILFLDSISCYVLVSNQSDFSSLALYIKKLGRLNDITQIHLIENNLIHSLNDLISKINSSFFYYDNLHLEFEVADFFENIQEQNAALSCPLISISSPAKQIALSDLLSNSIPESTCIISLEIWRSIGPFDAEAGMRFFIWDYFIRAAHETKAVAMAVAAFAIQQATDSKEETLSHEGYHFVVSKHQTLIEASLAEIINLISSEQELSLRNRKQLQEKITSLQTILSHSKEELQSFQHLTAQLQQRIGYLENNWYQKLKTKVNRVKKIFFKKKSPGSGTLKRILQFIRFSLSKAGLGLIRKIVKNILKKLFLIAENRPVKIMYLDETSTEGIFTYHDWICKKLDSEKLSLYYEDRMKALSLNPKISIIMPVYNTPLKFLKEAIESVIQQNYSNWELCIADDNSSEAKVKKMLRSYDVKDARIKVIYRETNGHISAASNAALELVSGDYILLMDHDDLLAENCLAEIVLAVNDHPNVEIIYSDEDKIDEPGIHQAAHFKPDWAPDHLLSRNYMGHLVVLKKALMDRIQGFRLGFEGSQDYDLLLRATELTNEIIHIPKVLYHWRIHTLSAAQGEEVKPYAYIAAKKALGEALQRRGLNGEVKYLSGLRGYQIDYAVKQDGKVSIIIPTKDQTELLKNTIDSILQCTTYTNYEIIILNNNSTTSQLNEFLVDYTSKYPDRIFRVEAHFPFNFSKLMNKGASVAKGEYLLLLNNDVEVIHADWLTTMVSYAQQQRVGAVGVKLLYPDDTIQHAGVIVGLGGVAGHTFVGAFKDEAGYFNYIQSVNNYSAVTAACLLVRKDAFDRVQGMDEQFEVEYNDVDFCLKLMDAGYNNVYLPQVELYHYESATRGHPHQSKPSYERHLKEMKLFKNKWQKYIDQDPYYNPNLNLGVHDFSMNFGA